MTITPTPASASSLARRCASAAPVIVSFMVFFVSTSTSFFRMINVAMISALCASTTSGTSPYQYSGHQEASFRKAGGELTSVTFLNQFPEAPFDGPRRRRRRAAICVLTLGFEKCRTDTCTPVTSLMIAPPSSLCAAPSEKDTPRPE